MLSKKKFQSFLPIKVIIFFVCLNASSFVFAAEEVKTAQENEKVFCTNLAARMAAHFARVCPKMEKENHIHYCLTGRETETCENLCSFDHRWLHSQLTKSHKRFSQLESAFAKCSSYDPNLMKNIQLQQSMIRKCFDRASEVEKTEKHIDSFKDKK